MVLMVKVLPVVPKPWPVVLGLVFVECVLFALFVASIVVVKELLTAALPPD